LGLYVKEGLETKEVNYFQGISEEKNFEMSVIELSEHKISVVYIDNQMESFIFS
jgi:hypothetical protein